MSGMISVIIPAHNEQAYLNRTIDNFLSTAKGKVECVVVLNGYDQEVDPRATVLRYPNNMGERAAMNAAAAVAKGEYLLRIDAHCDISPVGWDLLMIDGMKPRSVTVAVLTAVDKEWNRIEGHWYGFCKLLPTMEEKWWFKKEYGLVEPNMGLTGCGMMIAKDFYWSFGGADETLPTMGAIGPEFALRGWLDGDGVYTRTDVICGHIFDTGGYDTNGVLDARKALKERYGHRYKEIAERFGDIDMGGSSIDQNCRTVTVTRDDEHITKDESGKVLVKRVEHFKYVYTDDGQNLTEEQVREKYAPLAKKVGEDLYYPDQNGKLVKVA
jgi:glycosyltransferase involved in cell wall biosynthesis